MSKPKKKWLKRLTWLLAVPIIMIGVQLFLFMSFHDPLVLMYHFVGPKENVHKSPLLISTEAFQKQLDWLKKWGYRVYSLDEFYAIKTNQMKQPQKGVVLTFDDGNQDFYTTVFPMIQKANVPAANFLVCDSFFNGTNGSMSPKQAKSLLKSPLVTFGVHTTDHKALIGLTDKELREEISDCKDALEKELRTPMYYFAYPGGYLDDGSVEQVKKSGFKLAFTTARRRLEGRREDIYKVVRIKITEKDLNPIQFWVKVSGLRSFFKRTKWAVVSRFPPKEDISRYD